MNIVLLDDELVALEFLRSRVAAIGGATPVPFSRPTPALEWCAENDADVVIVDYMMPEIDGIAFAKRVRELPGKADIPVLMITAAGDAVVRQHALAEGIDDFLTNPVNPVELNARLADMIALRSGRKRLDAPPR
jgi:DNA-binding response OmpR family regulator